MAKKILAVVLAVMIAVSAMAITVFADQTIALYPRTNPGVSGNPVTDKHTISVSFTFDIPLYALYGYMDSEHYMVFTLPTNFSGDTTKINWTIIVNGTPYALESTTPGAKLEAPVYDAAMKDLQVSEHRVNFGYVTHGFIKGYDTTIPQSTAYGDIQTVRLVADIVINNNNGSYNQWYTGVGTDPFTVPWGQYTNLANVQFYNADGSIVNGSRSFIKDWNPTYSFNEEKTDKGSYVFVTEDWTTAWVGTDRHNKVSSAPLTWDHTLQNKAAIYGAAAETVQLVVKLADPITGQATYSLWAATDDRIQDNWWSYSGTRTYVGEVKVDGAKVTELVFDVPLSVLYDSAKYGTYNQEFVIFENITLKNDTLMRGYLRYKAEWWEPGPAGDTAINLGKSANSSLGRLSWAWSDKVRFDGEQVRYAAGGVTDPNFYYPAEIADIYAQYNGPADGVNDVDTDAMEKWLLDPAKNVGANMNDVEKAIDLAYSYTGIARLSAGDLAPVKAAEIYILIPEDEDNTDVTQPVEPTDTDEEEENVDTETPAVDVEPEDEPQAPAADDANPTTGVALAVVPMLVAAAAAVVSKKH